MTWKGDSNLLQVNYLINGGFKCLTRDVQAGLDVMKGPARSDGNFVFSVSEAPLKDLNRPICFIPNGSLTAGYERRKSTEEEIKNGAEDVLSQVIFWEKNGLRHGEFKIP